MCSKGDMGSRMEPSGGIDISTIYLVEDNNSQALQTGFCSEMPGDFRSHKYATSTGNRIGPYTSQRYLIRIFNAPICSAVVRRQLLVMNIMLK